MKPRESYRVTTVRLVEFHNLGTTTVELPEGGHLFLLGDNGSGRTPLRIEPLCVRRHACSRVRGVRRTRPQGTSARRLGRQGRAAHLSRSPSGRDHERGHRRDSGHVRLPQVVPLPAEGDGRERGRARHRPQGEEHGVGRRAADLISPYRLLRFTVLAFRFRLGGQSVLVYRGERKAILSLRDFFYTPFGFRLWPLKMFLQPCANNLKT